MKILQLTTHFSPNVGGVETHLNDLVRGLTQRNHQIFVLTYRPLITKVKWKMYEKGKNLEILRLPWFPGFFYSLVNKPLFEFLYLIPGLFVITPIVLFLKNPDVIHSHGLIAGLVAVFWGKVFKVRVITTTHSIYNFSKTGPYFNIARWMFANSDVVLTLSKQSKDEIVSMGVDNNKIRVFTYWIDLNKFKPVNKDIRSKNRERLGWKNSFVVLFVGRLVEEKGVIVLLESAKNWNKNIILVIIGTGPLEEKITNYKLQITNFEYMGKIDNDDLPLYYSSADLLIVPSIHEEGFGRVILESLACGTPVIAANRGAIPEAMDASVGKLINITSNSIKDTVEYFYKNNKSLKTLSLNARKFSEKKYSDKNILTITNAYNQEK